MDNNNESFSQESEMSADYVDNCLVIEEFANGTNIEEADMLAQLESHEANDPQTKSRGPGANSRNFEDENLRFACTECDSAFINGELLRRHKIDAHNRSLSVAEHLALSRRVTNKTPKAPVKRFRNSFYCDCGERFSSQTFLNLHKRKAHPVEITINKPKNNETVQSSVPNQSQVKKAPLKAAVKIKTARAVNGQFKSINLSKKMALANLTRKNKLKERRNIKKSPTHIKGIQRGRPSFKLGPLPCLLCNVTMSTQSTLCSHARIVHKEPAFIERKYFSAMEQFRKWLSSMGESCFFKASSNKRNTTETAYYYCKKSLAVAEESTFFNGKSVEFHCTAFIIARIFNEDAENGPKVEVQFCASHSGNHDSFNCATYLTSSNDGKLTQDIVSNEQKNPSKIQRATPSKNQTGEHRKSGAKVTQSSQVSKIVPKTQKSPLKTPQTKKSSAKPKSNEKLSAKNVTVANGSNDDDMVLSLAAKVGQKIFDVTSPTKNLSPMKQSAMAAKNLTIGEALPSSQRNQTNTKLKDVSKIDQYIEKLKSISTKLQSLNVAQEPSDEFLLSYVYFTIDSLTDICSKLMEKKEHDECQKRQANAPRVNGHVSNIQNSRAAPRNIQNSSKKVIFDSKNHAESTRRSSESLKDPCSTPSMAALMLELRERVERIEKLQFKDDDKEVENETTSVENMAHAAPAGRSQKRTIDNTNLADDSRSKQPKLNANGTQKAAKKSEQNTSTVSSKQVKSTPSKSQINSNEVELENIASKAEDTLLKNGMRRVSGVSNGKPALTPRKSNRINLAANKEYIQNKKEIPGSSMQQKTPKLNLTTSNSARKPSPLKRVFSPTNVVPRRPAAPVSASSRNKPFLMKPAKNSQQLQKVTALPTISFENDEDNFVYDVSIEEENV